MSWFLVTGAKGSIGTVLTRYLAECDVAVGGLGHGLIPLHEQPSRGLCAWVNGEVTFLNLEALRKDLGPPSAIFHLAGGSSVGKSLESPREDFARSVESSIDLLEWARQTCPHVPLVVASSAAVYGDGHRDPIREGEPLRPYSPYGTHKQIVEALCSSYCTNYGLQICILRLFSVYGPELRKQLIYDLCVSMSRSNEAIVLGGSGDEVRDFLYIDDAVRLIAQARNWATDTLAVVNGGTGDGVTVRRIVQAVQQISGNRAVVSFSGRTRPGDPFFLVADTSELNRREFVPQVPLIEGLERTVNAYGKLLG